MNVGVVMDSSSSYLLSAHNLVKRFGGVTATDDVSINVKHGEVVGIIGPNGAGKTTLIGLLSGGLVPTEGKVEFNGNDVTALGAPDRARGGIGRTYQIPRPFLGMSVRENLLAARFSLHPFDSSKVANSACDAILENTGLADVANHVCGELPLLRRKRLEVARALALSPKLLLLDEVGAGLVDSEVTELIDLIKTLKDDVDGIIIIEHVLKIVRECCDRLVVINFGKKFHEGTTNEVLFSDEVAAIYLGTAHSVSGSADESLKPAVVQKAHGNNKANNIVDLVSHESTSSGKVEKSKTILELSGIHAGYGQARVLNGVDLRVEKGEVVAILGTNGAGKTTLSQVINCTLRPTAGKVFVDGKDVTGSSAHIVSRLGLSQCLEGRRIFSSLTVEENLLLPAREISDDVRRERLELVYDLFPDLKERRKNSGTSMSGGQQQMLAIGRSLMSRPRLVLFDEISLGLAPVIMDRLYEALVHLREAGLTMIIVEQDVERALELADCVHVMEHGKFAMSGSANDLRNNKMLRDLYIGTAD